MPIYRCFAALPALALAFTAAVALAAEMSREELHEMEDLLARLGFPPGDIDGTVDDKTRDAIAGYQDFAALPGDPEPSRALLEELRGVLGQVEALRRTRDEEADEDLGDFGAPGPEAEPPAEGEPVAEATAELAEPEPQESPQPEPEPEPAPDPAVALAVPAPDTAMPEPAVSPAASPSAVDNPPAMEEPAPAEPATVPDPLSVEPPPEELVTEEPAVEEPGPGEPETEEPATEPAALAETPPDQGETSEPVAATEATASESNSAEPQPAGPIAQEPTAGASVETMQTGSALVQEVPEEIASGDVVAVEPVPEEAAPEELATEAPSPEVTAAEVSEPEETAPEESPVEPPAAAQVAVLPTPAQEPEPAPAPGPSAAVLEKARISKALAPYQAELSSGELSYGDLARNFNDQGRRNFNDGHYDQALGDFDTAIYLQPNFAAAYHNRAKVYQAMGEDVKAQQDFDKAFDLGFTRLNLQ